GGCREQWIVRRASRAVAGEPAASLRSGGPRSASIFGPGLRRGALLPASAPQRVVDQVGGRALSGGPKGGGGRLPVKPERQHYRGPAVPAEAPDRAEHQTVYRIPACRDPRRVRSAGL